MLAVYSVCLVFWKEGELSACSSFNINISNNIQMFIQVSLFSKVDLLLSMKDLFT